MNLNTQTAKAIGRYLDQAAFELECSFWDPAVERVTPENISQEIEKVRRWAKLLQGSPRSAESAQ